MEAVKNAEIDDLKARNYKLEALYREKVMTHKYIFIVKEP